MENGCLKQNRNVANFGCDRDFFICKSAKMNNGIMFQHPYCKRKNVRNSILQLTIGVFITSWKIQRVAEMM